MDIISEKVKEANLKKLLMYDFIYMTFPKRQNHGDNKKILVLQGWDWEDE